MEIDNYTVKEGSNEYIIYPIVEFEDDGKSFLVYASEKKEKYDISELYIGLEQNGEIVPIDEKMVSVFEKVVVGLIKNK